MKIFPIIISLILTKYVSCQLQFITYNNPPLVTCTPGKIYPEDSEEFSGIEYTIVINALERAGYTDPGSFTIECIEETLLSEKLQSSDNEVIGFGGLAPTSELINEDAELSVPTWSSGLYMLISSSEGSTAFSFLSVFDMIIWILFIMLIFVIANFVWYFEKDENKQISKEYVKGLGHLLWNTMISVFLGSQIKIKTLAGRSVQAAYYFTILVLTMFYVAELINRYKLVILDSSITTLYDAYNYKVGILSKYKEMIEALEPYEENLLLNQVTYFSSNEEMVGNLTSSNSVNVILVEKETSFYYLYERAACDLIALGVPVLKFNYHMVFSPATTDAIKSTMNQGILEAHETNMDTIAVAATLRITERKCLKPFGQNQIQFDVISGIFITLIILVGLSFIWIFATKFNKRKMKYKTVDLSEDFEEGLNPAKNSDFKNLDLILKFDSILRTNEKKLKRKLRDLTKSLNHNGENMQEFIVKMKELLEKADEVKLVDLISKQKHPKLLLNPN